MLSDSELAERQTGLGGGDAMAYSGIDPRKTLVQLYEEKTRDVIREDAGERADWGSRLEPVVRSWLEEEIGKVIYKPVSMYRSAEVPMMIGHLDGVTDGPDAEGVEIKTTDKYMAREFGEVGTDEIPVRYVLQVTHYMVVTGLKRFHIGALIGGNQARHYVVDFDPELAGQLIQRARLFWSYVEQLKPPEPANLEDAKLRWPRSAECIIKAPDTIMHAVNELKQLRSQQRQVQMQADSIELSVKSFMREAAILADESGHQLATWREQLRPAYNVKAMSFRKFLLK